MSQKQHFMTTVSQIVYISYLIEHTELHISQVIPWQNVIETLSDLEELSGVGRQNRDLRRFVALLDEVLAESGDHSCLELVDLRSETSKKTRWS